MMTSLIAWIGIDARRPSSLYLASDSRLSWGNQGTWDLGRKLFASRSSPELLGYGGDVLFPSLILGQITDMIDAGILFTSNELPKVKVQIIFDLIKTAFLKYPSQQRHPFSIVYCTRSSIGMACEFSVAVLSWDPCLEWSEEQPTLPKVSNVIWIYGSGETEINNALGKWRVDKFDRTTRAVFGAFCDAISSEKDAKSGGAPQLVGLYQKGLGKPFGIIHKGECFLYGLPISNRSNLASVEWRNSIFEPCDWKTMQPNAQRHMRPKGV